MNDIIRKSVTIDFEKDSKDPSILHGVVGSTIDEDRDDDVLDPKGADLGDYKRNPLFLANHDYDVREIIGKTFNHEVTDQGIKFSVQFDMEDPAAAVIARKYANGFAKAISVGFRGLEATQRKNLEPDHFAHKAESSGLYFSKWAVREFSAVAVPANPNALAAAEGGKSALHRGDGLKASILELVSKDKDIRSAVRGLLMGTQFESGSESEVEPSELPLKAWLSSHQ